MTDIFNDIIGQDRAKTILSDFSSASKIPHALLFTGNEGVGKEFTAIRFAQLINSGFLSAEKSKKVNNLISQFSEPYIKYIIPLPRGKNETDSDSPIDKLSKDDIELLRKGFQKKRENPYYNITLPRANAIKINSIRDIKKFIALDYSDLTFRCIIISDAHLMNEPAQNALLKNLEEPPEGVIFILITPFPERLRETIRSRCWNINFDPLTGRQIVEVLTKYFNISIKEAEAVAPFAGGSVTTSLKLIDMNIKNLTEQTISILRYSFGKKFHSAFQEFSSLLAEQSNENIKLIVKMIITWLNDLQKYRFDLNQLFFRKHKETLEKFNSKFPDVELKDLVYKLDRLSSYVKNNVNPNLLAANIIFELSALPAKPAVKA
ncbi:DNA polymerase III subunit tau [bacterium BMS3Abin03]|nr:DNA polymerase III subunit tau [bacterium BMS3Abin03]